VNQSIQFDPNGGDLGRGNLVEAVELSIILPHVAHILEELFKLNNSRLPYKYAFEFRSGARKAIELVMMGANLPDHVEWYETDGMKMFMVRSASGGVASTMICYLVTKVR